MRQKNDTYIRHGSYFKIMANDQKQHYQSFVMQDIIKEGTNSRIDQLCKERYIRNKK